MGNDRSTAVCGIRRLVLSKKNNSLAKDNITPAFPLKKTFFHFLCLVVTNISCTFALSKI